MYKDNENENKSAWVKWPKIEVEPKWFDDIYSIVFIVPLELYMLVLCGSFKHTY